jgi:hypothetical protein
MPLATTVKLPKKITPRWPQRCVSCGTDVSGGRGSTLNWWTHAIGWWTVALLSFGKPYRVKDVPVCMMCKSRVRWQRWLRILMSTALIVGAGLIWLTLFRGQQFPLKRAALVGLIIVTILPWVLWEIIFPPPLDVTAFKETVDFDFRETDYALEFANLNKSAGATIDE